MSITCDNASNNDVMVNELETLLPSFSTVNHTRCFLHVNNLVARTLAKQFDAPKQTAGQDLDEENDVLMELAGNMEFEEHISANRCGFTVNRTMPATI